MVPDDVQTAIRDTVLEQLTGGHIVDVESQRGEDFDGDEVITITIVVDSPASSFEPRGLAGLLGHLRSALFDNHEYAFPMVSFMSPAERGTRRR